VHEHTSSRRRRLSVGTGSAALSLSLCLCAGQLIATPAASAATTLEAQAAAVAVAKAKTGVRTTLSSKSIASGSSVRVTGRFYNQTSGAAVTSGKVRLLALRGGKWRIWQTKTLGSSGVVTFTTKPLVSGYYRVSFLGNSGYTSVTGGWVRVAVRPNGAKVLTEAKSHTGALYKYGAAGPSRFDCSGFTLYVFKKTTGKNLPHKANSQQRYGTAVAKKNARIGDLIVFRSGSYGYHAGIYAGGGYMYDSPHSGARVGKHKMYGSNYVVRRLVA
jgi:cell wall-associated NlpC family hydrolase